MLGKYLSLLASEIWAHYTDGGSLEKEDLNNSGSESNREFGVVHQCFEKGIGTLKEDTVDVSRRREPHSVAESQLRWRGMTMQER